MFGHAHSSTTDKGRYHALFAILTWKYCHQKHSASLATGIRLKAAQRDLNE
jgi:hypothetical protein